MLHICSFFSPVGPPTCCHCNPGREGLGESGCTEAKREEGFRKGEPQLKLVKVEKFGLGLYLSRKSATDLREISGIIKT